MKADMLKDISDIRKQLSSQSLLLEDIKKQLLEMRKPPAEVESTSKKKCSYRGTPPTLVVTIQ